MKPRGAAACGHPATAGAAREILEDGGNAFDAALAAMCAATVAEPVLSSLGGGGFLLAQPAEGPACLYDFFVETPLRELPEGGAAGEIDFYPIEADFGTATQEFHIGLGAIATPGVVAGLFAAQEDLARLPMKRLVEPAVRLARDGVAMRPIDEYLFEVIGPILTARADSSAIYTRPDGGLLKQGDATHQPDLAGTLEALAAEGADLFYRGDLAKRIAAACREQGGLLTAADLERYRVARRKPLQCGYRGARILTNPPPSTGGILVAFALALLSETQVAPLGFGSLDYLTLLTRIMALTNQARVESRLHEAVGESAESEAAARLLDPALLARYRDGVLGARPSLRGTTHISVIDAEGNMAALTLSNGEGCGFVLPGSGIMLNNMLGEEDLSPTGFHRWSTGSRLSSMMAPTLAMLPDGRAAALGSGGSNRIRTAILQVLLNLIDFEMAVGPAVESPRFHFEGGVANLEGGMDDALCRAYRSGPGQAMAERVIDWPVHNLFFGGAHAVTRAADGRLEAAGDPRRGGAVTYA